MQLLPIISEFIAAVGTSSSLEIYNSAGLRYELALHLKTQLPPELYGVHLSRKLKEVATPSGIPEAERQRIDLYVFHRDKKEQYGINLKLLKKEEKLTRLTLSEEVKSLDMFSKGGFKETYSILVAPSHLLKEVEETTTPVSAAEHDNKLKMSTGKENNSSKIPFPDQVPWQLLRLPCTGDSVQWYYALIKNVK
jgi:hypothetical protein